MSEHRRFLLLHGWQNHRPPEHWQWQLAEALRTANEQVLYPQLPDPDHPSLDAWTELARAELVQLGSGERVVVAHSLSVLLWLHLAARLPAEERVSRVLLVAPPSPSVLQRYAEVAAFAEVPQDGPALGRAAASTRMIHTDNDSYCPEGAGVAFAGLGLDADVIVGGGHLDIEAGYGWWPSVLDWCRDARTRLVAA